MIYRFLGDSHAERVGFWYPEKADLTLHLGDLGLGFRNFNRETVFTGIDGFIRGNHDSPEECRAHPLYLGDYGYKHGVFFLSGAWSIDQYRRREGISWWKDEQLSMEDLTNAVTLYEATKPDIVISHDAPFGIIEHMNMPRLINGPVKPTQTTLALMTMLQIHRPAIWVFGHWHFNRTANIDGTQFYCVAANDKLDLSL